VEGLIDERIRTLCLVVCAMAVVYFAMWTLSEVLVLFFLAVALKYLLTPLIDFLSCRHPRSELYAERCYFRLGRKWAVLFALLISVVTLMAISFIVANSLSTFASRAGIYNARVEELIDYTFSEMHRLEIEFGLVNASDMSEARQMSHLAELEKEMAKHLDVSDTIVTLLGTASGVLEDVVYILLFLVFMLVSPRTPWTAEPGGGAGHVSTSLGVTCRWRSRWRTSPMGGHVRRRRQSRRSSTTLLGKLPFRALWA